MLKSFKIKRTSIRKPIVALVATGVAVLGGVAFATWTATGTGNGYAKAGTATPLTFNDLSLNATVTANLFPGTTSATYWYQIHNPNPYPVTVTSVDLPSSGALVTVIPSGGACTQATSGVTYTAPGALTPSIHILANSDSPLETFAGASMSNASDNSCQGLTFGLALTASGQSG